MIFSTFFNISSEDTTAILAYGSGLFSDALPIIKIIIGVGLGLLVIYGIASVIKSH